MIETKLSAQGLTSNGKAIVWGPHVKVQSELAFVFNTGGNLIDTVRKKTKEYTLDGVMDYLIVWPAGPTYIETDGKVENETTNPNAAIPENRWLENMIVPYSLGINSMIMEIPDLPQRRKFMLEQLRDVEVRADFYELYQSVGMDFITVRTFNAPPNLLIDEAAFIWNDVEQFSLAGGLYGLIEVRTVEDPGIPKYFAWGSELNGFLKMQFPMGLTSITITINHYLHAMANTVQSFIQYTEPKPYNKG